MNKLIVTFVCALLILSACEKVVYKGSGDPISTNNPGDTTKINNPVVTALSFSTDVVPVITMCNNCHIHNWSNSPVASTFYTNLVNQGYVKPASYTSSTIYAKLNSGHPGSGNISTANSDKIVNWMKEGSKNN